jgi:hypothetical protein
MGKSFRLSFGTGSDPGRYGADSGPRHTNCHIETVEEGKHPAPIYADDGTTLFASLPGGGACRGMSVMNGALYVVSGNTVFKVTTAAVVTTVGSLAGTSDVIMDHNDAATPQLVIVADGVAYKVESDALTQITDGDLGAPVSCTFLNQRMIYARADGINQFSAVDDVEDIDALDFFTAEGNPDGGVRTIEHLQELWVFGAESIEIWVNTGNASAPFRRQQSGVIPKGCIGAQTIAKIDRNLFWVGDDGIVYAAAGYGFERISHFGVEESIRETSDKTTIEALAYILDGHAWYELSSTDWTWQFNRTTGRWHERTSRGIKRRRASKAVAFNNQIIVGDYERAALYTVSQDAFDEDGDNLVWRVRSAPMHAFPNQISVDALFADFVTGVGLNSSDTHESDPQVGLRWSDDGGKSWSNQRLESLGAIGERQTRVTFYGLGTTSPTGRIWELEVSAPVARALMYAAIEGDELAT